MNDPDHERAIVVGQLHGFAQDLGLDEAATRAIVERVIADIPLAQDDDRLALARNWMLIVSA